MPGEGGAFSPDDEDYMDEFERAEALHLFRPGKISGGLDRKKLARAYRSGGRTAGVPTDPGYYRSTRDPDPEPEPESSVDLDSAVGLVMGVVAVGLVAGWFWRRYRQGKALEARRGSVKQQQVVGADLRGLNVLVRR